MKRFKTRGEMLLALVPKPGAGSDDELDAEPIAEMRKGALSENAADELDDWTDNQIDAAVEELFEAIGHENMMEEGFLPMEAEYTTPLSMEAINEGASTSGLGRTSAEYPLPLPMENVDASISGHAGHLEADRFKKKTKAPRRGKIKKPILKRLKLKWKKKGFRNHVRSRRSPEFEVNAEERTPLSYFYELFSAECIELIVYQSNLYFMQQTGGELKLDRDAVKAFIGITMMMGIVSLPAVTDYWSHRFKQAPIADVMSIKKFLKIRRFIHFSDNSVGSDDPFVKVRKIAEMIRQNCLMISPEHSYSIDEMMVPYKGTKAGSRKQYMPTKSTKWGFKLFVRSGISGIVYDFFIYSGAYTFCEVEFTEKEQEMNFSSQCIVALCKSIKEPALNTVFFDNFFSNPESMIHLWKEYGILTLGTMRRNRTRNAPISTEKEILKNGRGAFEEFSDNGEKIALVQWSDSKAVLLAITYVSAQPVESIRRWSKEARTHVDVQCPQIILEYNKHMGGVDLSDMLISLYRTPFRSHRWPTVLFAHLIDICVMNAWQLYRRYMRGKNEEEEKRRKAKETGDGYSQANGDDPGIIAQQANNQKSTEKADGGKKKKKEPTFRISPLKEFRGDIAEQLIRSSSKGKRTSKSSFLRRPGSAATSQEKTGANHETNNVYDCQQQEQEKEQQLHLPVCTTKGRCRNCQENQTTIMCQSCNKRLCLAPKRNCYQQYHNEKFKPCN